MPATSRPAVRRLPDPEKYERDPEVRAGWAQASTEWSKARKPRQPIVPPPAKSSSKTRARSEREKIHMPLSLSLVVGIGADPASRHESNKQEAHAEAKARDAVAAVAELAKHESEEAGSPWWAQPSLTPHLATPTSTPKREPRDDHGTVALA